MVEGGASMGQVFEGIVSGSGSLLWIVLTMVVVGGIALILAFAGLWYWYNKKRWNLIVEIKLARSNGQIITGELGKGFFDAKRSVCFIRRPGTFLKKVPIKVFDIRRYLQGPNILTVIQLGPEDYRPVLNKSWTSHSETYVDDVTGKEVEIKEAIINIKIDNNEDRAWKDAFETASKKAYSITSFIQQFQTPIAIGIVVLCCFVGFAILWTRLGAV